MLHNFNFVSEFPGNEKFSTQILFWGEKKFLDKNKFFQQAKLGVGGGGAIAPPAPHVTTPVGHPYMNKVRGGFYKTFARS